MIRMDEGTHIIQAEFDRLALVTASEDGWTQNSHYHDFLLRNVPSGCRRALEIGCGAGAFSRRLATRSEHVLALDLSPEMLRLARERSCHPGNLEFQLADAVAREFPPEEFDCIATVATLHHMPFALMLAKMERALKPGGVLLIRDLLQPEGFLDALTNAAAYPVCAGLRLLHEGRLRSHAAVRAAWAEHEQYDSYLTLSEVQKLCAQTLPGARVRKHLLWRYSVVWKKVVV
jgi:ubiquinone/menaquinone biosynthesis C-methylase UbiE